MFDCPLVCFMDCMLPYWRENLQTSSLSHVMIGLLVIYDSGLECSFMLICGCAKGLLACDNFRMLHRFSIRWRSCYGNVITWQWEQQPKEYPGIRLRDLVPQRSSRFMFEASEMGSFWNGQWRRIRKAPLKAEAIRTGDTLYWKEMQEGAKQAIDVNSGWVVLKLDVCDRKTRGGAPQVSMENNMKQVRTLDQWECTYSQKARDQRKAREKMFKSNNWSTLPKGKAQEKFNSYIAFCECKIFRRHTNSKDINAHLEMTTLLFQTWLNKCVF